MSRPVGSIYMSKAPWLVAVGVWISACVGAPTDNSGSSRGPEDQAELGSPSDSISGAENASPPAPSALVNDTPPTPASSAPATPTTIDDRIMATRCPEGQMQCNDRCINPSYDWLNCGGCDLVCPQGTICRDSNCSTICPAGEALCDNQCVATASDPNHCGGCGQVCEADQLCNNGTCDDDCAFFRCDVADEILCVDIQSSARHCGACGFACPDGQSCVDSTCSVICTGSQAACDDRCVDTETNAEHCGGCGITCAAGTPCVNGKCGCPDGQALCNGVCTDIQFTLNNCGGCGITCGPGAVCNEGMCQCLPGDSVCGVSCVNFETSRQHCGACDVACDPDQICDQGSCVSAVTGCSGTLVQCDGGCVDTTRDTAHCGSCGTTCPSAQTCEGGRCVCPGGGALCANSCVDLQTDGAHCGGCDNVCQGTRSCVGGACTCPAGESDCGNACVDTDSDDANCGACGVACSGGRTCVGGACGCPTGQVFCGGACVDPQTDGFHCGGCDQACGGGSTCMAGSCECPGADTLCDQQCVDTNTSLDHCGACGNPCAAGESCNGGRCEGPLGADGCRGAAFDVDITEIAAYQAIKIPLMTGGSEVPEAVRVGDVVQQRETLFRVFVDVEAGFAARELSARLSLTNGGTTDQYFARRLVSGSSADDDTASTFQIYAPADKIGPSTTYAVEVVECGGGGGGTLRSPSFPSNGSAELGARLTGPLRIVVIPIQTDGLVPDTDDATLAVYRDYVAAMYPTHDVQITVGDTISTDSPVSWNSMLDQIRAKRAQDSPASDVYYYGLVKPEPTIREYCMNSCVAGIGYVPGAGSNSARLRAAVGLGYGSEGSASTMAHELGHNHGRNHSPCRVPGPQGIDPNYPHAGGLLGVWGYDQRTRRLLDPDQWSDLMGYCSNPWVSDYTYRAFADRIATVNGLPLILGTDPTAARYQVMILDQTGPRWGLPFATPAPPFGEPEGAEILDAQGNVTATVTVYRTLIADNQTATVLVPEPDPSWYAVKVRGWPPLLFSEPGSVPPP